MALHKANPDSTVFKLLPFNWGATSQQQTAQAPSPGTQVTTAPAPQKSETADTRASLPPAIPPPVATYPPPARENVSAASGAYDQVQVGMSPESVRQILGGPLETRVIGQLTEWEYDIKTGLFQVTFQGGRVAYRGKIPYHTSRTEEPSSPATTPQTPAPAAAGAQAAGPAVTTTTPSKDYTKIVIGMTPDMVKQTLGEPAHVKKLRVSIEWEYQTPKGTFEVRFRGDKVVYKGMTP